MLFLRSWILTHANTIHWGARCVGFIDKAGCLPWLPARLAGGFKQVVHLEKMKPFGWYGHGSRTLVPCNRNSWGLWIFNPSRYGISLIFDPSPYGLKQPDGRWSCPYWELDISAKNFVTRPTRPTPTWWPALWFAHAFLVFLVVGVIFIISKNAQSGILTGYYGIEGAVLDE